MLGSDEVIVDFGNIPTVSRKQIQQIEREEMSPAASNRYDKKIVELFISGPANFPSIFRPGNWI